MSTITDSQRRRETAHRAVRVLAAVLAVAMLVLPAFAAPVAAQTNETNPCTFGPPVPGQQTATDDETMIELALTLDGTTFTNLSNQEQIIENSSKEIVGQLDAGDEASVVSFSDPTLTLQNLTGDLDQVNQSIESYGVGASRSDIDLGIDASADQLLNSANATENVTKVLFLLSDGYPNDPAEARAAATTAKDAGILLITVAFGDNPNTELMEDLATSPEYAYNGSSDLGALIEEVEQDLQDIQENQLRIDTRDLFKPGQSHGYTVYNVTYVERHGDIVTLKENVTSNATLTSSNSTVLSVNGANNTLVASSDPNTSTWVRVNATANGATGCTNVIVAKPTLENLRLVPGIWRFNAVFGDSTLFALLIATLLAVPMARFTSAFGGLAVAEMVMVVAWFAGYVSFGTAAVSLFVALFIGLNLAANIDYGVRRA